MVFVSDILFAFKNVIARCIFKEMTTLTTRTWNCKVYHKNSAYKYSILVVFVIYHVTVVVDMDC